MANFKWTDEAQATLLSMAVAGKSAGQIALRFGITRNAVIGRMKRTIGTCSDREHALARFAETQAVSPIRPDNVSPRRYVKWSRERTERAIQLADAGYSHHEIACDLGGGVTRNAVSNRIKRVLGVGHDRTEALIKFRQTVAPTLSASTVLTERRPSAPPASTFTHPPTVIVDDPCPPGAVTLAEREPGQCCWPYGDPRQPDFRYCGKASSTGRYCSEHMRRMFQFDAAKTRTPWPVTQRRATVTA